MKGRIDSWFVIHKKANTRNGGIRVSRVLSEVLKILWDSTVAMAVQPDDSKHYFKDSNVLIQDCARHLVDA